MRTILLLSTFAVTMMSASGPLAQPPAPLAPPPVSSLRPPATTPSNSYASLPEAPTPAVTAGPALAPSKPCHTASRAGGPDADSGDHDREPCLGTPNPFNRFLDTTVPVPLTPTQKAHLAAHNLTAPGNLATIVGLAGLTIGTNSHTAYGPGWSGFGRAVGYSYLQDATGEFFGTFLIPSLTHQDPHYRRIPQASVSRRTFHAIAGTLVAQSDTGAHIPNYSALLTNPICAELSNLYVPGINGNGPSTTARIMTGYGTDAADNLITEFLPDVARHVHVRVIFVQRILNQVSNDQYVLP
jgi:hypothetical protein